MDLISKHQSLNSTQNQSQNTGIIMENNDQTSKQESSVSSKTNELAFIPLADVIVSIGANYHFRDGIKDTRLLNIYRAIKRGTFEEEIEGLDKSYQKQLEEIANLYKEQLQAKSTSGDDSEEYKAAKKRYTAAKAKLPVFTWSGNFDPGKKGTPENGTLVKHSGRLQIDIDGLGSLEEAAALRAKLENDPHTELPSLSPGRHGVKASFLIGVCKNDAEHKRCFAAADRYFKETYDTEIDPACKDVRRVCYLHFDPDTKLNKNAVPLDIEKWVPKKGDTKASTKTKKAAQDPGQQEVSRDSFTSKQPDADIETLKRDSEKYLTKVLVEIRQAPVGTRHNTQVRYAYSLGGLTAGGSLIKETTLEQLVEAARESRSEDPDHAERTVRECFAKGEEKPYWRDPIYAHLQENNFLLAAKKKDDPECHLLGIDQPKAAAAFMALQDVNVIVIASGKSGVVYRYNPQTGIWRKLEDCEWMAEIQQFLVDKTKICEPNDKLNDRVFSGVANQAKRVKGTHRKLAKDFRLNPNPDRMVLRNGVLDLKTGEFSYNKFCREDYADRRVEIDYDPLALSPQWDKFLLESIPIRKDRERMQELVGYLLYPKIMLETVLLIYGTGRNGKGVFQKTINRFFQTGTSLIASPLNRLCEPAAASQLVGACLNSVGDASFKRNLSDQIKTVISGEEITVKFLYEDPFTYAPHCKHLVAANDLPTTDDHSEGFFRRWNTYQFKHELRESGRGENTPGHARANNKEADADLGDKLAEELPGIFNWAMDGLVRLRSNNWKLTEAPGFKKGDEDLRSASDTVQEFLDECTNYDPWWDVSKNGQKPSLKRGDLLVTPWNLVLYAYELFCKNNHYGIMSSRNLKKVLKLKGFTTTYRLLDGDQKDSLNGVEVKRSYLDSQRRLRRFGAFEEIS